LFFYNLEYLLFVVVYIFIYMYLLIKTSLYYYRNNITKSETFYNAFFKLNIIYSF